MAQILPFNPLVIVNELEDIRIRLEELDAELNQALVEDERGADIDTDWDARARLISEARLLNMRAQQFIKIHRLKMPRK